MAICSLARERLQITDIVETFIDGPFLVPSAWNFYTISDFFLCILLCNTKIPRKKSCSKILWRLHCKLCYKIRKIGIVVLVLIKFLDLGLNINADSKISRCPRFSDSFKKWSLNNKPNTNKIGELVGKMLELPRIKVLAAVQGKQASMTPNCR